MDSKPAASVVPNEAYEVNGRAQRPWNYDEDEVMRRLIGVKGEDELRFIDWRAVVEVLPWRTPQQCRGRWRRVRNAALTIAGARGHEGRKPTNKCKLCGVIRLGHSCPYLRKATETPQTLLNRKKASRENKQAKEQAKKEENKEKENNKENDVNGALPVQPEVVLLDAFVAWRPPSHADIIEDADWVFGAVLA